MIPDQKGEKKNRDETKNCGYATDRNGCGCVKDSPGCCGSAPDSSIVVEYLYLDRKSCARCIGTEKNLDEVMSVLTPALELAGFSVQYEKIEMDTAERAMEHRFVSSPTVRVNGVDIAGEIRENDCGCCGEISGTKVDCRVFPVDGQFLEVPPLSFFAKRILTEVFVPQSEERVAGLPENLIDFYEGKKKK